MMEPTTYLDGRVTQYIGDVRDVLAAMPTDSVDCVVTSPPYWRQRDYNMPRQIGLEPTPEAYISNMVAVFREVRRVLRPQGTCWINIGDKWAHAKDAKGWRNPPSGYKDKDLVGVPFMLAFAMRADGWFWRQCNVWAKPNCMPESVRDRSTISHEYVLHFSKSNDYWYDSDAARTPPSPSTETRLAQNVDDQEGSRRANGGAKTNGTMKAVGRKTDKQRGHSRKHAGFNERWDAMGRSEQVARGANLRSVWWISPAQYKEGHFAVMPDRLAEICILAGCPKGGLTLDPFGGAGTTALAALRHGRLAALIELNPEYAEMARRRIETEWRIPQRAEAPDYGPLFSEASSC